jgi:tryptophan-rich sensory protein
MNGSYTWYAQLIKPSWAPPAWLFGPVWTVLYLIIFISFGAVFLKVGKGEIPKAVALPFILNLIFNFAFTPLQFGLRNNYLAASDIALVFVTLVWSFSSVWSYLPWVVWVNLPYWAWVTFATILQFAVTYLNR